MTRKVEQSYARKTFVLRSRWGKSKLEVAYLSLKHAATTAVC